MTNVNEGAANPAQKTVLLGVTGCIAAYKSCAIHTDLLYNRFCKI